ncbi:hypothetical protein OIU34_20420 [Pararhizobium sp. BT-229]|uniref:hypothetical protein n=1 Tax=Pararhizobium sp. BT-229 TaxID=2986923 RepID=UPI0021F7F9A5|nr:hypothetical protein [Pararhizobium sp. BT-229]MCV9964254.1 hypothetical protein [Pararhizobium sp. BT-229]
MAEQIESGELWDRLALILGDEADRLPPRSSTEKSHRYPFSHPFNTEWLDEPARNRKEVVEAIEGLRACAKQIAFGNALDEQRPTSEQLVSVFKANYEYARDDGSVSSTSVQFTAVDEFDAITSAIRFWMGRQKAIPDNFNQLFAVSITNQTIGPISASGSLFNGTGFSFFEWKIDSRGMALETYALVRMVELIKFQATASKAGSLYPWRDSAAP